MLVTSVDQGIKCLSALSSLACLQLNYVTTDIWSPKEVPEGLSGVWGPNEAFTNGVVEWTWWKTVCVFWWSFVTLIVIWCVFSVVHIWEIVSSRSVFIDKITKKIVYSYTITITLGHNLWHCMMCDVLCGVWCGFVVKLCCGVFCGTQWHPVW